MFACIAGPVVAALSSFFEHADEEEMLHECIEGLLSVARICQYGLEDTLDEFITSFCKFTTLLNPYASIEETMFTFSHDLKPRMATVAVFTIANYFRDSIQGGWKNIVDCLLKLKRIKLLPQSLILSRWMSQQHLNQVSCLQLMIINLAVRELLAWSLGFHIFRQKVWKMIWPLAVNLNRTLNDQNVQNW